MKTPGLLLDSETGFWTGGRLARVSLIAFIGVVAVTTIVYLFTANAMGTLQKPWDILTGSLSPFSGRARGWAVVLSALGYLLVPATVGLVVADGVSRFTRKHLIPMDDVKADIRDVVGAEIQKAAQLQKEAESPTAATGAQVQNESGA